MMVMIMMMMMTTTTTIMIIIIIIKAMRVRESVSECQSHFFHNGKSGTLTATCPRLMNKLGYLGEDNSHFGTF